MRAATVLASGGAVAACAAAWRAHLVGAVAPELRHPVLLLPQTLGSRVALAVARRRGGLPSPLHPGVTVLEQDAGGSGPPGRPDPPASRPVRVLVYRRRDHARPSGALVWMHGGGLVLGAPEYDHDWCSRLAAELGIVVVNVDYRLAPEHPFPAALDDCFAALRWVHSVAAELGVDPARVAVGGSSAGGGLAAAVAQRAADAGVPVALQLLRYPMLDDRTGRRALRGARGRLGWTLRSNRFGWGCYLGDAARAADLPAYAAAARRDDLAGLAPAWIGVGELDLFLDEDVDYARRLRAAGVPCELVVVPRMYHGADGMRPDVPSMRRFTESSLTALRAAVGEDRRHD